jgi:putative selenium metabolism hydrolase
MGMDFDRANALARQYQPEMTRFLRDIIRLPSESRHERDVIFRIRKEMDDLGYRTEIDPMGNLLGHLGSGPRIAAFDGHIDTVGIGLRENWMFDPYEGFEDDAFVGGRGASDQKGGVADMVYGGKIMRDLGLLPDDFTVVMTATVQEED